MRRTVGEAALREKRILVCEAELLAKVLRTSYLVVCGGESDASGPLSSRVPSRSDTGICGLEERRLKVV